jgi:hypothetical protein
MGPPTSNAKARTTEKNRQLRALTPNLQQPADAPLVDAMNPCRLMDHLWSWALQ